MKVYRIKDWSQHYENNRTREIEAMRWVPFPNTHDGDGYCQMVDGPAGAAMLGAWVAVVQVASKCKPRGTLLRKDGTPHTAQTLATMTRLPVKMVEKMLDRACMSSIGWMELVEYSQPSPAEGLFPQAPATLPQAGAGSRQAVAMEWNGRKEGRNTPQAGACGQAGAGETAGGAGGEGEEGGLVGEILAAYPRQEALKPARAAVARAIVELGRRRGLESPGEAEKWLLERVIMFAVSKAGRAGRMVPLAAKWFTDARYDDQAESWDREVPMDAKRPVVAAKATPEGWQATRAAEEAANAPVHEQVYGNYGKPAEVAA